MFCLVRDILILITDFLIINIIIYLYVNSHSGFTKYLPSKISVISFTAKFQLGLANV
ncbi:hypothetical protein LCGC14_1634600 [marine sediment metagenome]|uniref:Uncharacterized protein n=1 Tax=marine sediment metagenome TaxID=412755 RepID=A0A0F9L1A0_9ZZZZ